MHTAFYRISASRPYRPAAGPPVVLQKHRQAQYQIGPYPGRWASSSGKSPLALRPLDVARPRGADGYYPVSPVQTFSGIL